MKKLWLAVVALMLAGCTQVTVTTDPTPTIGRYHGDIPMSGGGIAAVYTFEVDGVKCITAGRYSAVGMSCNWSK